METRREAIFKDDTDRQRFIETLGEVCARTGWRVHAFVLMSNHYHLMIETPEPNLVAGMRWFAPACARALSRQASAQTTWTMRFNARHQLNGLGAAERILAEGLRCFGLEREALARLKKGDPRKASLAVRIRTLTMVPNGWIAEQLYLGHVSRVNQCAHIAPRELLRRLEKNSAR